MSNNRRDESSSEPETVTRLIGRSVAEEGLQRLSAVTVTGIIALGLLVCLGLYTVARPLLQDELGGLPRGAVVAFDGPCPTDRWVKFGEATGRTVVGAGSPAQDSPELFRQDENGDVLPTAEVKDRGGHSTISVVGDDALYKLDQVVVLNEARERLNGYVQGPNGYSLPVKATGKSIAQPNMPPWIALTYCRRS